MQKRICILICMLAGFLIAIPFIVSDNMLRAPVSFVLSAIGIFLVSICYGLRYCFVRLVHKRAFNMVWWVRIIYVALITILLGSPLVGYGCNYLYSYRMEKFGNSLPSLMREYVYDGGDIPPDIKIIFKKYNGGKPAERYLMINLTRDGGELALSWYSLFRQNKLAIYNIKQKKWKDSTLSYGD